jgi:prepilin-type N-terminal cleavage/methylation domain-containing protein
MSASRTWKEQAGFTLLELMISVAIFIVLSGAMFSLLTQMQKGSKSETQVLDSFEEARLGMDQIVRDVSDAGYPPANHFSVLPVATNYAQSPVAWNPGPYPGTPCLIGTGGGGTCVTPGDFDVVFEEDYDGTGNVRWVRYQLVGTTLMRGVTAKAGVDPIAATAAAGIMVPYVLNVMNNATAAQIAQFRAVYPAMFPGGNPVPIFQYSCDIGAAVPQLPCPAAGAKNSPVNIHDVQITLIVQARERDAQTQALRLVELNGRGHRLNPNK